MENAGKEGIGLKRRYSRYNRNDVAGRDADVIFRPQCGQRFGGRRNARRDQKKPTEKTTHTHFLFLKHKVSASCSVCVI